MIYIWLCAVLCMGGAQAYSLTEVRPQSFKIEIVRPSHIIELIKSNSAQWVNHAELLWGAASGAVTGLVLLAILAPTPDRFDTTYDSMHGPKSFLAGLISSVGAVAVGRQVYHIANSWVSYHYRNMGVQALFTIKQDVQIDSYRAAIQNLVDVYGTHVDMLAHMLKVTESHARVVLDVWRHEIAELC